MVGFDKFETNYGNSVMDTSLDLVSEQCKDFCLCLCELFLVGAMSLVSRRLRHTVLMTQIVFLEYTLYAC